MDKDTELTMKCLRHLLLPPESSRTRRNLSVQEIPEAAKEWKPGNVERILGKVKPEVGEEDLSMEWEDGASLADLGQVDGSKVKSLLREKTESLAVPVPLRSSNHITKAVVLGRDKEETARTKYLAQGNFNPPRKLPSPPKRESARESVNDFCRGSQPKQNEEKKFRPAVQKSLFSTHQQQEQSSNGFGSRNPVSRFEKKQVKEESFESKGEDEVKGNPFKTAHEQLVINDRAKGIKRNLPASGTNVHVSGLKKTARFDPPTKNNNSKDKDSEPISDNPEVEELMQDPLMKNIDPKMVETVLNEVFDAGSVDWNDIAGLQNVKNVIKEIIIWPMLRPDIFTGLRGPPKGILLFGPPGTGKTMIGKLIATQSKSSFFNISASSLTSKWIGDGEKMVRALFAVARVKQPSVIFIDEIDSILTQRSDTEHESSRRLKTEFLIQFDGCGSKSDDRILVIGVTNRPQELDEAARRRLVKRIYIPLPDCHGRKQLVQNLLGKHNNDLSDEDYHKIAEISEGYSGADMASLCQEASYGPIRDVGVDIQNICADEVRPMALRDFEVAIRHVKASVAQNDLVLYEDWDEKFGCHL